MSETIDHRDLDLAYQAVARDPKYVHFVNIPERIVRCLDHFGVVFDRVAVIDKLHAYYLFIGVVDHAIDSGAAGVGKIIFERLGNRVLSFEKDTRDSDVKLVTNILKREISDDAYPLIIDNLRELYQEVVSERAAKSIESYIQHRKAVGRLTAEQSYLLIRSLLDAENAGVCRFMQQVGEVGCLVDSMIDLGPDDRLGLLGFKPTMMDFANLSLCTLRAGLGIWVRHLRLTKLFFEAIVDNIRDRFRTQQSFVAPSLVNNRKDEAASVA